MGISSSLSNMKNGNGGAVKSDPILNAIRRKSQKSQVCSYHWCTCSSSLSNVFKDLLWWKASHLARLVKHAGRYWSITFTLSSNLLCNNAGDHHKEGQQKCNA
jgi:hypothetical protein